MKKEQDDDDDDEIITELLNIKGKQSEYEIANIIKTRHARYR